MQETKIVDGFIWAVIEENEAKENLGVVYKLYSDDTESLIDSEEEFDGKSDNVFGIEIGFEIELKKEFEEGEQNRFRNNDNRDFNQWLDDKINLILE